MVDQITQSLKRLFETGKIDEEKINSLLEKNIISKDDEEYIKKKDGDK